MDLKIQNLDNVMQPICLKSKLGESEKLDGFGRGKF
jgi:hypothetical protein